MRWRAPALAILLGLLVAGVLLSLAVGAVTIPLNKVVGALLHRHGPDADVTSLAIIWQLRFPRVVLAALIGGALATAGAAFQGLFRNPLADPFVVGASGGAALGATLAIVAGLGWGAAGFGPVPLAAFIGSLLAVAVVYSIAQVGGVAPAIALLLAGVAISTFLGAVVSLLMILDDQNLHTIFVWLMGGLSGRSWPHLWASMPYMLCGMGGLWLMARPLDALASGDETARSLGLSLGRTRWIVVAAASLATAAAVAAGGIIGFVGLIAPHAARLIFGANHARLLPASALLGALLMLLADDAARTVLAPVELPVGIVTAMLGGPFFLYLLRTRQRQLGAQR